MTRLLGYFSWWYRWYASDRIRLSPTRGSLVRLQAGDRVLIRERLFTVVERKATIAERDSQIVYRLRLDNDSLGSPAAMYVDLVGQGLDLVSARLDLDGQMVELFEEDPVLVSSPSPLNYA